MCSLHFCLYSNIIFKAFHGCGKSSQTFHLQNGSNIGKGYDYESCIGLKVKPRQGDGLLFYSLFPNGTIDQVIVLDSGTYTTKKFCCDPKSIYIISLVLGKFSTLVKYINYQQIGRLSTLRYFIWVSQNLRV